MGAIFRAMANFDLFNLVVVSPKCNILSDEAKRRTKHRILVLESAKVTVGSEFNLNRSLISHEKLSEIIYNKKGS